MPRRPGWAPFWVASYHDGSFARPTGGVPHLIVSDFPLLGLVGAQEVIQGPQAPVVIGLQPEGVIDPGAYALGVASGYSLLRHRHQLGVHGCGKPSLRTHTFMLHLAYDRRNILPYSPRASGSLTRSSPWHRVEKLRMIYLAVRALLYRLLTAAGHDDR
jgi:hypothetical protein